MSELIEHKPRCFAWTDAVSAIHVLYVKVTRSQAHVIHSHKPAQMSEFKTGGTGNEGIPWKSAWNRAHVLSWLIDTARLEYGIK